MRICEQPKCNYPVFGTDRNTRIGYCKSHQYLRTDKDKRTALQKHLDKVKDTGGEVVKEKPDLDKFFEKAAKELSKFPFCENCSERIDPKDFRSATAHILEKSHYVSVAIHPLNKLFLGPRCGCHNDSHRWDTFQKMQIWPKAKERILMMIVELSPEEYRRLPEFIQELDKSKQPF